MLLTIEAKMTSMTMCYDNTDDDSVSKSLSRYLNVNQDHAIYLAQGRMPYIIFQTTSFTSIEEVEHLLLIHLK